MITISQFSEHVGQTVVGHYTLTGIESRTTQYGDPFRILRIADSTRCVRAYVWVRSGLLQRLPMSIPTAVTATLHLRQFQGDVIADVEGIRVLEAHEVDNAAALLPYDGCPAGARQALATLTAFVDRLEPQVLRAFLNRILMDPQVMPWILTCKASQRHHHHEPGGLLVHSVEAMQVTGNMSGTHIDPLERSIAQVCAFLHDLGKLRTVGCTNVRPVHYLQCRHEIQTLRLLDRHIEWLRAEAADIAAGVEYSLDFLTRPPSTRGQALFIGPELVFAADHLSAALVNHRSLDDLLRRTGQGWRRDVCTTGHAISTIDRHTAAESAT